MKMKQKWEKIAQAFQLNVENQKKFFQKNKKAFL